MASANVIKLRGVPLEDEQLETTTVVSPGDLVEVHISAGRKLRRHAGAGLNAQKLFALNRDELGQGPADADSDYAIADQVKTGHFSSGMRLRAQIASGETVTGIEALESDGAGALQVAVADAATDTAQRDSIVAYSAEDSGGALGAKTLLEVEVA